MKVNCLGCGHMLSLDDAYDDYCGPVRCSTCRALMTIECSEGKIKSARLEEDPRVASQEG